MTVSIENIGEIIRYMRMNRGMSRRELAKKAGISLSAISRFEGGTRTPRLETLISICEALGARINIEF